MFVLCRRFRHHSEAGAGISTMVVDKNYAIGWFCVTVKCKYAVLRFQKWFGLHMYATLPVTQSCCTADAEPHSCF